MKRMWIESCRKLSQVKGALLFAAFGAACAPSPEPVAPPPAAPAASAPDPALAEKERLLAEARAIAQEAYVYGFPMVENYKTMFGFALYKDGAEYKGPFNTLANFASVATPKDTTVVTPNSDTPYSMLWADLRAEPLVLSIPKIDKKRYYSLQFIDLYTHNFAYAGTRATGSDAQKILLAGPGFKGELPQGINHIFRAETEFAFVVYRTQLFNPNDMAAVKRVQAGYLVQPLSAFAKTAPPPVPLAPSFPIYSPEQAGTLEFFHYLAFLLQFAPVAPAETELRTRLAKIGIEVGKPFDVNALGPEMQDALKAGMADGRTAIETGAPKVKSAADLFGTREFMAGRYLDRAIGAKVGIYGTSKEEAYYFNLSKASDGAEANTASNKYTLTFAKDQLPPVSAFWSVTAYDGKTQLLIDNPLKRYLINSPMLNTLKKDAAGGITLYIQKESPGKALESNWLPAADGDTFLILRCYGPMPSVLAGEWQPPVLQKVAAPAPAPTP